MGLIKLTITHTYAHLPFSGDSQEGAWPDHPPFFQRGAGGIYSPAACNDAHGGARLNHPPFATLQKEIGGRMCG